MDDVLYESCLRYFTSLANFGYRNDNDVKKLLFYVFIQELVNDTPEIIPEPDYKLLEEALYSIYGTTCLMPYPDYCADPLFRHLGGATPNTDPIWETISESCQTITVNGVTITTGYKQTNKVDINPYSDTYEEIGYILEYDGDDCPEQHIGEIRVAGYPSNVYTGNLGYPATTLEFSYVLYDNNQIASDQTKLGVDLIPVWSDGTPADYEIDTVNHKIIVHLPKNNTGVTRTLDINVEERITNVPGYQPTQENKFIINIRQSSNSIFKWEESDSASIDWLNVLYTGETKTFDVISTSAGDYLDYDLYDIPVALTVSKDAYNNLVVTVPQAASTSGAQYQLALKQHNTNEIITMDISQDGQAALPDWQEISRSCNTIQYVHSVDPSAYHTKGTATVVYRDMNPDSPTGGQEYQDTSVLDTSNCPVEVVAFLEFSDGTTTKNESYTKNAQSNITIPLNYYVNDVVMTADSYNTTVYQATFGGSPLSVSVTNGSLVFSLPANTSSASKTGTIIIKENLSNNGVTLNITQEATNYVFAWHENNSSSITKPTNGYCSYSGTSYTLVVDSTEDGSAKAFSVKSGSMSSGLSNPVISGSNFTITVDANPTYSPRQLQVTLKQNDSNNEITLTVNQQEAPSTRVFTWDNNLSTKAIGATADEDTYNETVISTRNGTDVPFTVDSVKLNGENYSTGIVTINNDSTIDVDIQQKRNLMPSPSSYVIKLRQTISGLTDKVIELDVNQQPYTPNQLTVYRDMTLFGNYAITISSYVDEDAYNDNEPYDVCEYPADEPTFEYATINLPRGCANAIIYISCPGATFSAWVVNAQQSINSEIVINGDSQSMGGNDIYFMPNS